MPESKDITTPTNEPAAAATTPPPRSGRVMRIIRRTLLVLVLLVLALLGSLQTGFVREFVKGKIVSFVEANTNGTISIGEIGGNLITGLSLSDVRVRLKNDTTSIARIKFVSVRYSILDYLRNDAITLHSVVMESPSIYFHRSVGDSLWNYARFFKPSAPTTQTAAPFSQTIRLEDLSLSSGSFRVLDETDTNAVRLLPNSTKKYIRWSDLDLHDISLALSGRVQGMSRQYIKLDHLSLREANAPFNLYLLTFSAYHDSLITEVKDLRLLSDHTDLRLDASMSPLGVLAGLPYDSLRTSMTHLKLHAQYLGHDELAQFIPDLAFLAGRPSFDLEAEGPYGALKVTQGRFGFGRGSTLSFSGEVRNLHQPEKLYLDVDLTGHSLSDKTLRDYVPGLGIPDINRFGTIDIDRLGFKGPPDNFAAELALRTSHGSINGKATLDVRKPEAVYSTTLATHSLDLGPIFGDSSLRSDINMTFTATGSGFDLKTMKSLVTLDGVTPSRIYGLDLSTIHFTASAEHGILRADKSSILFADGSHIEINYVTIDPTRPSTPYECDLSATDAPLAKFVPAFPHGSTVSAEATLSGDVSTINATTGSIHAVVTGLPYHGTIMPPVAADVTLQRDPISSERSDVISSDIGDLTVRGRYDIITIGGVLADRLARVGQALQHMRDSTLVEEASPVIAGRPDSINCSYSIRMKDLRALDHFLPGITLLAKGKLDGEISGEPTQLMNVSLAGTLDHFLLASEPRGDSTTAVPKISVKQLEVNIALRGLASTTHDVLRALRGNIRFSSDSALRIAGLAIFTPLAQVELTSDRLRYELAGNIEGKTAARLKGGGSIAGAEKSFSIDSFKVSFSNGFDWYNEAPSQLTISPSGLMTLDTLRLFKPEPSYDPGNRFAQKLQIGLQLLGDSIRYAFVHSPQVRLPDIPRFFSSWMDVSGFKPSQGKINRMTIDIDGTLSHPNIVADIAMQNFAFNNVTLDSARTSLTYHDGMVRGVILAHVDSDAFGIGSLARGLERWNPIAQNQFRVDIDSLPFLLTLADYPGRRADSARIAQTSMHIRASARDYPVDMFGPFIPTLTQIHGLADATLSVTGTTNAPVITAEANITKGSFMVPYTNIPYRMDGPIRFEHSDLIFDNVRIRNYPIDLDNGRATLSGGFHFRGFEVDSFDLVLRTADRLMVLNDNSKDAMKTIYGPLIVSSGTVPIEFHGTFDRPHLDGDLTIDQAYLTLPQSSSTAANIETNGITYMDAPIPKPPTDSTNLKRKSLADLNRESDAEDLEFARLSAPSGTEAMGTASSKEIASQSTGSNVSFMDRMLYDLNVDIPGDCWLIITFPQAYGVIGTQLKAELKSDGLLHFFRERPRVDYSMTGTLGVTERSSYTMIKEFTPVRGTMKFYKAMDNPTLDLSADYSGAYGPGDIRIRMLIVGTRNDPHLTFELWQKNQQGDYARKNEPQEQQRNESFFFLATGMLPNDAGAAGAATTFGSAGGKLGASVTSGFASSLANSVIASTIAKDLIRSVGIEFGASTGINKYSATFGIKDIVIHTGISQTYGSVSSEDLTAEVPFSSFLNFNEAKNMRAQFEYHNSVLNQSLIQPPPYLGRFIIRIPLN